ncbi:MAG: 4-alpha-glucanotransferase [Lachnospiraceae bacterium]|nr:4-alpha-glucanotransferase [Lachnospiraceae bacterium]
MAKKNKNELERGAGLLLPISSLPSPYGIGTFGDEGYRFVDMLVKARQKYWQVLPLGPTSYGDSPYQSFSAFAGNPYYIDLDYLVKEGLLMQDEIYAHDWGDNPAYVDYEKIFYARFDVLRKAYQRSNHKRTKKYTKFCEENSFWLEDYSFYMALKVHYDNQEWLKWDEDIRFRKPEAMERYSKKLKKEIEFWKFTQFKFYEQWFKLKEYANKNGVKIIGDIPLYVALDSADVWAHGRLFELDERKNPINIAGVPPDKFSETGQRWGNPLYDWDAMEKEDFNWWYERMHSSAELYDIIRIDHFIGIVRYFAIPAECETAEKGVYRKGPGKKLTDVIDRAVGDAQIIAEDLGVVVPEVINLMKKTGYPGMKILSFAFNSGPSNEYLPHNYENVNQIVYGGTHDNETLIGFFKDQTEEEIKYAFEYMNVDNIWDLADAIIRTAYASPSTAAIFQVQDILKLDNSARMNTPAVLGGNWMWRMVRDSIREEHLKKLETLACIYGRCEIKEEPKETEELK